MSKRGRKVKRRGNKQMALCDISGCSSVVEFSRMRRFPPMELVQERVAWWAALYGRLNFRLTAASAGQLSVCPKHFTSPRRLRNEHPAPVLALPLRTVQPPPIPTELVREDAGAVRTYSRRGDAQAAAAATGTGAPPRYKAIAPAGLPAPPPPTSTVIGWPVGQRAMPAAAVVSRLVPAQQQQQQQQFHIVPAGQASVTPAPGSFQVMSAAGSAGAAGGGGVIQLVGAGGVSGGGGAMQLLPTSSGQLLLMQSGQRAAQQVLAQTSGMSLVMVNSNGQPAPQPQQQLRLALPRLPRPLASEQQRGGRRGRASSMTITSVQSESGTPAAAVAEEDDDIQVMDVAFGLPVSEIRPKTEVIDLHDDDGSDAAMSDAGAACDSSAVVQAVAAAQGDEEASTVTVKSESSNDEHAPLLPKLEPVCKLEEPPAETAISGPSVIRLKPLSELTSAAAAERGSSAVQPPRIPTPPGISLGSGVGPKSEAELMLLSMQAREAQRKEQQQQQQREQQQQQQQQQKQQQQQQQQQREQQQQQQQQQKRQQQQQQKLRQAFRNRLHRLQEQSIQQQQQQQLRQTFPDQLHRVQQLSRQQTETPAQQGRPASSGVESAPPAKRARTQEDDRPAPVSATDRPPNTAAVNGPSAAADGADDNVRPSLEVARRAVEVCRITREVRGAHVSDWQLSEALSDLLTGQQLSDWSAAAQALRSASYHETLVGLISHFVASEKLDATEPQRPPPEPVKSPEPVVSSERADSPERNVSVDPANRDGQGDPDDPSPPADDPDQPPTPTPNGRESPPPEDVKPTFSLPAGLSITLLAPVEHPAQTESAGGGDSGGGGGDSDEDETAPDGVNGFSIIPVNQPAQLKPSALPPASPASTPAAPPAPPAPAAPARPSLAAAPAPAALLVRAPAAPPGAPVAPARLSVAAAYLARSQAPPQAPVERKITWKDRKQCVRLVRCYLCSAGNFASWTMVHQHLQTYHGESDILFPDTIRFNGGCLVVCALCSDVTPTACHSQSHALERHGQVVITAPAVICCAECHRVSDLARGCGLLHTELCRWRHGAEPAAGHCVYTCEPCELELHAGPGGTVYQHITAHSVGAVGAPSRCQLCEFRGVFVACQQHVLREHASRCRLLGCARCPQFCTNNWQEAERHVFERHVSRAGSPHGSSQPHAPRTTPCHVCGMALVGKETMLAQHMHMHRYSELAARRPGPRSRTRPDAPVALLPPGDVSGGDADLVKPSLDDLQDVWRDEDDCKLTMETRVTVKRLPQPTCPG